MQPLYIAVMLDARRQELEHPQGAHRPISRRRRAWFASRRRATP